MSGSGRDQLLVPGRARRGRRAAHLVTIATAVLATALVTSGFGSLPTATRITVTGVETPSVDVPDTPGAPEAYVVAGVPLDVSFSTGKPLSYTQSTKVVLTVTGGPDAGAVTAVAHVPKKATGGVFRGVVLPTSANGVTVKVAVAGYSQVEPGRVTFDVLGQSVSVPAGTEVAGIGGGGGAGLRCAPTAADPVCADVQLFEQAGVLSNLLLSLGSCSGLCTIGSFVQVLVEVDPAVYNRRNPIEVVAKCDKTLCGGKGVTKYSVAVQLVPGGPVVDSEACVKKGVVNAGQKFCTDYRQSNRDKAGDLHLMVLLAEDAKIIFK